jgi:hypothetical protein
MTQIVVFKILAEAFQRWGLTLQSAWRFNARENKQT